jgi:glycosyltransferase involved in cell wall biosynthesis
MNIICHAFPAWEGNYVKSTVLLMTELARDNRVLYVDYAYTWKDFFQSVRHKGFASWRRMLGLESRLRTVVLDNGASIYVLTLPPVLPTNFLKTPRVYDAFNKLNARFFMQPFIRQAMRTLNMTDTPVVVNAFNPAYGIHLVGRLGEARLVYYCYDEISAASWAKQHGARLEKQFATLADAVIFTSSGLMAKKNHLNKACYVVKNGVDFALFCQTDTPSVKHAIFDELDKNAVPTIGYLGSIDDRLDYDLLEKLIGGTPQYRYVFVGRVPSAAVQKRLSALPNVRLAGSQPPTVLPAWVNRFDVCLIPFLKNDFTAGIYPLKANEYLAAGKAVVATPFADLSDFDSVIEIADTAGDFQRVIGQNLTENGQYAEKRRAFAAQNAWTARAADMTEILRG